MLPQPIFVLSSLPDGRQVLKITRYTLWGDEIAKAWQTCPLVSGVGITGQTKSRAELSAERQINLTRVDH